MTDCKFCQKSFYPKRSTQIYCGTKCCYKAQKEREKKGLQYSERSCLKCGIKFTPEAGTQKYCFNPCKSTGSETQLEKWLNKKPVSPTKFAKQKIKICFRP